MKVRSDLVVENAEGELIVLDKDGGKVHQLNQSAALIWLGLREGLAIDEIAERMTDSFDVDHKKATSDVRASIAQLTELGLLVD